MKKNLFLKFFVLAVIGAFVTFTSCKDYDDDIKNLQTQIDKLLTKDQLTAELATLKTNVDAAKKSADDALAKANALDSKVNAADSKATEAEKKAAAAEKAAAQAKVDALAALDTELAKAKAELKASTDAELEKMNKLVNDLTTKVEGEVGVIARAITEVKFITATPEVKFSTVTEKANVFGQGLTNAITFVKDRQNQTGQAFYIKVSPANATITPEMISLQNGNGEVYENVEVTKVEPYTELYTRATASTGMWKVSVQLKSYNADAFKAATTKDNKKILFAVSINNTQKDYEKRQVISDYDLTLVWGNYVPHNALTFKVNDTDVADIKNRYGVSGGVAEYVWSGSAAVAPITSGSGVNVQAGDNRSTEAVFPAVQNQAFTISLTGDAAKNAKAIYVVLDEKNAVESAPSELNAWKGYKYTGLNTVVEGTSTTITIDDNSAINDEIGFRVFAVNHDGTLQDPDGKAFYIALGTEGTNWNAVNTSVTPQIAGNAASVKSNEVAVTLTKLTGGHSYVWTTDAVDNIVPAFHAYFVDADGNVLGNTNSTNLQSVDFTKVKKVYTQAANNDWRLYEDNKEYKGTLTIKNATGHVLATMKFTFKKTLPTAAPEGFSPKTNQIVDGIYNAYLVPNNWAASQATSGTMPMTDVFNYGTTSPANYSISFAASQKSGNADVALEVGGNGTLSVAKDYINNTTKHATTVTYNYGQISSVKNAGNYVDHKVNVLSFQTIYNNIYNSTYSWRWATKADLGLAADASLPYVTEVVYGDDTPFVINAAHIQGISTRDTEYNAKLSNPHKGSLQLVPNGVQVVSNANNTAEYFDASVTGTTITLTPKSGATNPTADVPSTLRITVKNMYDQNVVIELPMTVKKR